MEIAWAQNFLPPTVSDALRSENLEKNQMVASVVALDGGRLSLNWRDRVKVIPASTEKMVTTLAALEFLGPDWRWKTSFYYTGEISDGVLIGTLFIKGGGDPKYVVENLWRDLSRLKSMGINHIAGDVVIDRSYFEKDKQDWINACPLTKQAVPPESQRDCLFYSPIFTYSDGRQPTYFLKLVAK